MNREEVLKLVGEWLDAVCQGPSGDTSITIEKRAYGRSPVTQQVDEVAFHITTVSTVATATLPMRKVITP